MNFLKLKFHYIRSRRKRSSDKIKRKEERIIFNKKVVAVHVFLGIIHMCSVRDRTNILVAYILVSARKTNPLQDLHLLKHHDKTFLQIY